MSNPECNVQHIESVIFTLSEKNINISAMRREIRTSLQNISKKSNDTSSSLADTIKAIATDSSPVNSRITAAILIRLFSIPKILPDTFCSKSGRYIVQIVERGLPSLFSHLDIEKKSQTHKKLDAICEAHNEYCVYLQPLQQSFTGLHDLAARRQEIMKSINYGPAKSYFNPFGFSNVHSTVSSLLSLSHKTVNSNDRELQTNLQDVLSTLEDEINYYKQIPTFISQDFLLPFLFRVEKATRNLLDSMAERFNCHITVPVSPYVLEKRFPLHVIGAEICAFIPITNEGPGVAESVRAICISEHCDIQTEEAVLGDIEPGQIYFPLVLNVTAVREKIELELNIEWTVVGQTESKSCDLTVLVSAQRADVNWSSLSSHQPYSLEIANSEEFYGRKDAIQRILWRLAPKSMQSCYITGQKRVGKSSLAYAVKNELETGDHADSHRVLYLECGEIRHATGKDTLKEFGTQLETFLFNLLPRPIYFSSQDYSSSLNPLIKVLKKLEQELPEKRVVVILDEFDEINEELYRFGELAATFFLNLRTLASKPNLAFILVGAERMPYVMSSQGEKLNRFVSESLDSFDLDTEWADYRSLVEQPVAHSIKIHEPALRRLFELTNGHPYFTKVLCATIFECAVEAKDAEVSEAEVKKAADRVVSSLETNAFAHYWRDGIRGDSKDVEIKSLKRCRTLVAWARASRANQSTTYENIMKNLHSSLMHSSEVLPLLEDFCRRSVFCQSDDKYFPAVDLFSVWLREGGFSKLISDQLGDELAEAKQLREDRAYINANEIVELVDTWDLYQGRKISTDDVRSWINQVESNVERRILFKLLQNVRFFRDPEAREKFAHAHDRIRSKLPVHVRKFRKHQRGDIFVTYADRIGKSGSHYASLYAMENGILSRNIIEPWRVLSSLESKPQNEKFGLVLVDDLIGTGNNLVSRLKELSGDFIKLGVGIKIPLSVIVLCGTKEGESKVRMYLENNMTNADLEICEILEHTHYAFSDSLGIWESEEQKAIAKTLLTDLGVRVQKRSPLGYKRQGLLLTFPRNCPNNSLPILHKSGREQKKWNPIFSRSIT